ncbi:XdhC family protein [Deinococcus sp.]|uniref:XdhC family protein n=1 Tax=Deinococcus sp. TaxID=47478 RepID=UPI003CC573E5
MTDSGSGSFHAQVAALEAAGAAFVTATVVQRRAPVSSHMGDRAIVYPDGRMEGFVGGACSRDIVRRQALLVLDSGQPRLVMIRPDASELGAGSEDVVVVPMTCASEGAVNVYLEPHLPARLLIVAGLTPVAERLAGLGRIMDERVLRVVSGAERQDVPDSAWAVTLDELPAVLAALSPRARQDAAAVVASQGHYDELALDALLRAGVGDVSLLSSGRRAVTVRELLTLQGLPQADAQRFQAPAGLDLGARSPGEVALSILAGIVARRRLDAREVGGMAPPERNRSSSSEPHFSTPATTDAGPQKVPDQSSPAHAAPPASPLPIWGLIRPGYARSPVDGEEVELVSALHFSDHAGQRYYFSCPNCKRRFLKNPQPFLDRAEAEPT